MSRDNHVEAFCLMTYQDEVTGEREVIWNSRDGVTPFVVTSRAGNTARHVDWQRDHRAPGYIPQLFERVFVDLTLQAAREYRTAFVAKWWDEELLGGRMSDRYASPEEAVETLAKADIAEGGHPDLIYVDQAFLDALIVSRAGELA